MYVSLVPAHAERIEGIVDGRHCWRPPAREEMWHRGLLASLAPAHAERIEGIVDTRHRSQPHTWYRSWMLWMVGIAGARARSRNRGHCRWLTSLAPACILGIEGIVVRSYRWRPRAVWK